MTRAVLLLAAALTLPGCKLLTLEENKADAADEGVIAGRVAHQEADYEKLVAFLLVDEGGRLVARNYAAFAHPDGFLLRGQAGQAYVVGVFADRNGNGRPDADEPATLASSPATVPTGWKSAARVAIALAPDSRLPSRAFDALQGLAAVKRQPLPLAIGEVASLDDERFSPEIGQMGMWAPFDFAVHVGGGVYFLEPYDAARVPVLFVSGIGGHPREWKSFVEALDRTRYQAWFYVYPSGAPLESNARVLAGAMEALHRQYRFERLYVTAHSMGGLVSRGFIQHQAQASAERYVRLFVSVSTPWGGIESARKGVERSPVVMPSWVDVQTDSDYQRAIFSRPFAPPLEYHLLWGRTGPAERASDGVVSVASELRAEAVRDARSVKGFQADHRGILRDPAAIAEWQAILRGADAAAR